MYDVVIIGRGPAGISASLYTVRSNLKTLIIGKDDSRLKKADKIDNYFGFSETISGTKLLEEGEYQTKRLGAEILDEEVISIDKQDFFSIATTGNKYESKAVLLATGQPLKAIGIENLVKFEGRGVSYCTTCDGFFYNNLKVGVLGNKDYAIHEALELLTFTSKVTIFTNGKELDISSKYEKDKDKFAFDTRKISKLEGDEFLQKVLFADGSHEEIDGIFVAYESASSTDFARKLGVLTEGNNIAVSAKQETNLDGLFAAGDCTSSFKQISVAVGQGAIAGKAIADYVKSL